MTAACLRPPRKHRARPAAAHCRCFPHPYRARPAAGRAPTAGQAALLGPAGWACWDRAQGRPRQRSGRVGALHAAAPAGDVGHVKWGFVAATMSRQAGGWAGRLLKGLYTAMLCEALWARLKKN